MPAVEEVQHLSARFRSHAPRSRPGVGERMPSQGQRMVRLLATFSNTWPFVAQVAIAELI